MAKIGVDGRPIANYNCHLPTDPAGLSALDRTNKEEVILYCLTSRSVASLRLGTSIPYSD